MDLIERQAAIECIEHLSACDEPFVEIGTDDETFIGKYEAITEISDLPPAQPDTYEALRILDAINTSGRLDYGDYCDLHDAISEIGGAQNG